MSNRQRAEELEKRLWELVEMCRREYRFSMKRAEEIVNHTQGAELSELGKALVATAAVLTAVVEESKREKRVGEQAAKHRRKLLKKLDPKTRALAVKEFAKLGLKQ